MAKVIKHNFVYVASWILLIIGIINIFRLLIGWQVQIAGLMVPMWIYWVEAFVFLYLSFLGFQMKKEK
jgi:hypothetical protein